MLLVARAKSSPFWPSGRDDEKQSRKGKIPEQEESQTWDLYIPALSLEYFPSGSFPSSREACLTPTPPKSVIVVPVPVCLSYDTWSFSLVKPITAYTDSFMLIYFFIACLPHSDTNFMKLTSISVVFTIDYSGPVHKYALNE